MLEKWCYLFQQIQGAPLRDFCYFEAFCRVVVPELAKTGTNTCHVQGICVATQKLVARYLRHEAKTDLFEGFGFAKHKRCSVSLRRVQDEVTVDIHAFDCRYLTFREISSSRLLIKNGTSVKNRVPSLICFMVFIYRTRLQSPLHSK